MSSLSFALAQDTELDWLAAAEARIHSHPWTRGQMEDSFRVGHLIWVMREQGEPLGYAVLMPLVDEIELLNLSVLPEKQQYGLGRALLLFVLAQSQEARMQRMFLEVRASNQPARKLYERVGFTIIGARRNYYPAPDGFEDAIIMAKQLWNKQSEVILREMGLAPLWKLRAAPAHEAVVEPLGQAEVSAPTPENVVALAEAAVALKSLPQAMPPANLGLQEMGWDELRTAIAACTNCVLCQARKQAVPGVGDENADWLFVGEGPGAEEDERGEPFVGQAGKLLDAMLAAIDLRRGEDVYIANAVKCRPPNNRTPEADETAACWPYLQRQIELLQPKLIVALGRPAAQTLLQREVKISAVRGQVLDYQGIPLIVTYHPAYLLRTLSDKAKAWEDLCLMRRTMRALKG